MKNIVLLLLLVLTINLSAQMERFPLLDEVNNYIPESFIVEGNKNELLMFWIDSTDLHVSKSLDAGITWGIRETIVDNTSLIDSLSDLNVLKLNNGRIIVTYKHKFHYAIYSDKYELSWSEPVQLITEGGIIRPRKILESSLSQTNDNKIWFVYSMLNKIYSIQSDDGATWSERDTMVVSYNGTPNFPSINSYWDDSLVLIYQKTNNDTSDIYKSISVDSGKTWSEPNLILENGVNKLRPRVRKDSSNTLWLTYQEVEPTPFEEYTQTNVFYSKLENGSNNWTNSQKFTEYVGFDGWQNINIINDKQYITFTSNRENEYTLWYGIVEETNDNSTPPAIYETDVNFQNDFPNVTLNITAKVHDNDEIDSVQFHYHEAGKGVKSLQLFDDGLHGDSEEGDFIYGNRLTGTNHTFKFEIFYTAVDIEGNKSTKNKSSIESPLYEDGGDTFAIDNNNIWFPFNSNGVLADVRVVDMNGYLESKVHFDEGSIIYSAGFELSGYTNGNLWANGVATASRVEDYIHGPIDSVESLNQIHVVRSSQPDFYQSWINWKDAVKEGADFYDGDGDGIYNPVDLNGNGVWDTNEDKPDILGDITAFTIFNDGVESQDRAFHNVEPQGIEIKQTVFSYDKYSSPKLANVIFVRYNIENMGTVASILDSLYFAAWVDLDIGIYIDDLAGTDSTLNTFYGYNDGRDADYWGEDGDYGANAPACFISFIQPPPVYIPGETFVDENGNGIFDPKIDTSLDSAISRKGELLGVVKYPGAKNNKLTASVHYISSHPTQGDADNESQVRSYMLGYNQAGGVIDPCDWEFGEIFNEDCNSINPSLMYAGDPVTKNGWINRGPDDQRQMGSTGPFDLVKGKPIEIIVAYIVGRGTDPLNSITEARRITNDVIDFYNTNFSYVPVGVKENVTSHPTEFSLLQNYPNPFNPSTVIRYGIGDSRHKTKNVNLTIYNVLGQEVATLVNQQQKAGSYEVHFDASNLTSGVYFYRFKSGSFSESCKMILIK